MGWPKLKMCPQELWEYWNYRCDMAFDVGLIMNENRIVIPEALKKEAPFAYKSITPEIDTLRKAMMASPVAELYPLMTVKG